MSMNTIGFFIIEIKIINQSFSRMYLYTLENYT
jgi:hypothetical protein